MEIKLNQTQGSHECKAHKEGDLIIYSCDRCSYQRLFNYKTRKTKKTNDGDGSLHHGTYVPVGLDNDLYHYN